MIRRFRLAFQKKYHRVPTKWIAFEDVKSIDAKTRYLMDKGFGGAMLFSLTDDDYQNNCFQKSFPLLRVLNYHLSPKIPTKYPNPYIFYDEPWQKKDRNQLDRDVEKYFEELTGPLILKCKNLFFSDLSEEAYL